MKLMEVGKLFNEFDGFGPDILPGRWGERRTDRTGWEGRTGRDATDGRGLRHPPNKTWDKSSQVDKQCVIFYCL